MSEELETTLKDMFDRINNKFDINQPHLTENCNDTTTLEDKQLLLNQLIALDKNM